ncbi:tRNA pseudouridine synthase B [Rhodothalassium salexigens DSM 2132]|uniref:tRNA pseudouridine synthase B n=1 Tax=Rhodothalassium salexigens DSM 2132 TaxID=1188247 RepID=A0A4R2PKB1_RHOSA|nr:tRNA pseudouridine(55) synthase TruB [Rhodothalassium salexigens]MBB4211282.1 tRNA pseudouridine55 synthase [Rhodothalassium salexigens DSM 2132]MBK1639605.1 tRNA pseudouridine(55) synthase TruB [Rhodothalassium salexigens DSM 2132]TCP35204.1 tRNA pseudouridine synthase B [Rhodothalassium salexigens DSM 2132]
MARRRRGNKLNGWIVLDKPADMTSNAALGAVKRLVKPQKAGFAGTLDPLATGILPIGLGEATKAMAFIVDNTKTYDFTIAWGEARDTLDRDGQVTETGGATPTAPAIEAHLDDFVGTIDQVPPAFSAIKVDGRRAYDLAREGEIVELEARPVEIDSLELVEHNDVEGWSRLEMSCGAGTYVRSLARDLAEALGTLGHVSALRRTSVGPFDESQAISLEKLEALSHSAPPEEIPLPVMTALADIPALAVTEGEADRVRHGQGLRLPTTQEGLVRIVRGEGLIAVAECWSGEAQPVRVFNL